MTPRTKCLIAEAVLSFAGSAISGTLWWAHKNNIELPCTASGGCDLVNASSWSHISFGPLHEIPIALVGLISYFALLSSTFLKLGIDDPKQLRFLAVNTALLSGIGVIYSWFLQYVAHFKIGAFCPWCFSSAIVIALYFVSNLFELKQFSVSIPKRVFNAEV
jgi:uncharacterized membrane protein